MDFIYPFINWWTFVLFSFFFFLLLWMMLWIFQIEFLCGHRFSFLRGYILWSGLGKLHGNSLFNIFRTCQAVFQSGDFILHFYLQCVNVSFLHILYNACYYLSFFSFFLFFLLSLSLSFSLWFYLLWEEVTFPSWGYLSSPIEDTQWRTKAFC